MLRDNIKCVYARQFNGALCVTIIITFVMRPVYVTTASSALIGSRAATGL